MTPPVLIAHLVLQKSISCQVLKSQPEKIQQCYCWNYTPCFPTSDFLGAKECKAHWTSSSKEKETKATGNLGNFFHFPLSSLSPSIIYPNKDTQLKHLDPWHKSTHTPLSPAPVPAWAHRSSAQPQAQLSTCLALHSLKCPMSHIQGVWELKPGQQNSSSGVIFHLCEVRKLHTSIWGHKIGFYLDVQGFTSLSTQSICPNCCFDSEIFQHLSV